MTDPVVFCRQDISTERAVVNLCRSEACGQQVRKDVVARMQDSMTIVLSPDSPNTMAPPSGIREPVVDLLSTQVRLCL
jgi:hypothetical protein